MPVGEYDRTAFHGKKEAMWYVSPNCVLTVLGRGFTGDELDSIRERLGPLQQQWDDSRKKETAPTMPWRESQSMVGISVVKVISRVAGQEVTCSMRPPSHMRQWQNKGGLWKDAIYICGPKAGTNVKSERSDSTAEGRLAESQPSTTDQDTQALYQIHSSLNGTFPSLSGTLTAENAQSPSGSTEHLYTTFGPIKQQSAPAHSACISTYTGTSDSRQPYLYIPPHNVDVCEPNTMYSASGVYNEQAQWPGFVDAEWVNEKQGGNYDQSWL